MAERRRQFRFAAVPVSMLAVLFFFGCAKQPATTMAMAPGAAGSSGAGVSGSDITGQGGSASGASDATGAQGRGAGQGGSQVSGAGSSGSAGAGGAGAGSSGNRTDAAGSRGGSAAAPGGTGAGGSVGNGGGAEALAAARPEPKEFTSVADLHDIHFEFDRYSLRAEDQPTLATDAQWFRAHPGDLILIEGHCDERGTNEYNLALGQHRAESAMKYLVGQGVPASRITVISYGEERPLCAEHSEDCWAKNRRAHFLVKSR